MHSLDNSYSKEDLISWETSIKKKFWAMFLFLIPSKKYDGALISINARRNGKSKAITVVMDFMMM
jgi:DNA ligase (NAD+)